MIIKLCKSKSKIIHIEERPGDVKRLYSDSSKVASKFNFEKQYGLKKGLIRTIDWYKKNFKDLNSLLDDETVLNWKIHDSTFKTIFAKKKLSFKEVTDTGYPRPYG